MILIPRFASTGASIGTLVAEFVVLIVQYHVLRNKVNSIFKKLPYWKIAGALGAATLVSLWIKRMALHVFVVLLISFILFMGAYVIILLLIKEPLTLEITDIIKNKFVKIKD